MARDKSSMNYMCVGFIVFLFLLVISSPIFSGVDLQVCQHSLSVAKKETNQAWVKDPEKLFLTKDPTEGSIIGKKASCNKKDVVR